jgi:hypothetical protein
MKIGSIVFALMILALSVQAYSGQTGFNWQQSYKLWGFDIYDEEYVHPGIQVELDGIEVSAVAHVREDNDCKRWDTAASVRIPVGGLYVRPGYGYYILPGIDVQAISLTLGVDGDVSPRYTISHIIPDIADMDGQIHTLGIDVRLGEPVKGVSALLSADLAYNDGVNPMGTVRVHDLTHLTTGLVLDIPAGDVSFRPGVVYQHSYEPELLRCDRNEVWAVASVMMKF